MELNDYQTQARSTAIYPSEIGLVYTALGLTGEAGEVSDKIKKAYRDEGGHISEKRAKELAAELGDVLWYIACMAYELSYSLESIAEMNIEKLTSRQQNNTLHGDGDNR